MGPPSLLLKLNRYCEFFPGDGEEERKPTMKLTFHSHVKANDVLFNGSALHFHLGGAWFKF